MVKVQFKEIFLFSKKTRKGARIEFHPRRNLITGPNTIGKSVIIKSLIWVFGIKPKVFTKDWLEGNPTVGLTFTVEADTFTLVRSPQGFHLRNLGDTEGRSSYFSSEKYLWNRLKVLFDVDGVAPNRDGSQLKDLHQQHFLSAFYIDQDKSWEKPWRHLNGIEYFKNPQYILLQYRLGLRQFNATNDYKTVGDLSSKKDSITKEIEAISQIRSRVFSRFSALRRENHINFSITDSSWLIQNYKHLFNRHALIGNEILEVNKLINGHLTEIELYEAALQTFTDDKVELDRSSLSDEGYQCPTCDHYHGVDFPIRFAFFLGEKRIRENILEVKIELQRLETQREKLTDESESLRLEIELLSKERFSQNVTVEQLLEFEGVSLTLRNIEAELENFTLEEDFLNLSINETEKKIQQSKTHPDNEIEDEFLSQFRDNLNFLAPNFTSRNNRRNNLIGQFTGAQGTEQSMVLISYYGAVDSVGLKYSPFVFPLIIDSPFTGEPTDDTEKKILKFINGHMRQDEGQLIIASAYERPDDFSGFHCIKPSVTGGTIFSTDQYESCRAEAESIISQ